VTSPREGGDGDGVARDGEEREGRTDAPPRTLGDVVDRITANAEGDHVTLRQILDSIGEAAYGPLLLLPALVLVSPLSGVPGLPTGCAVFIGLVAGHLLIGRKPVWLPEMILRRQVPGRRVESALGFLRPGVKPIDRLIRPRLTFLTRGPFAKAIGAICLLIALIMPPLELVPMGNTITGAAVGVFALALTVRDVTLAIVALAITGFGFYLAAKLVI